MLISLCAIFAILVPSTLQEVINLSNNFNRRNTDRFVNSILSSRPHDFTSECKRPCARGQNRLCVFDFHAEHYQAMGAACGNCSAGVLSDCFLPQCVPADGIEKGILTLNRRLPGPLIEVCQGDLVVVNVMNHFHSETFSIHWHGLLQRGTQYMDGVPHVTQCPITPMASFRYTFWADDLGTYFYHSHSGMQKYLGIYGGFIIRAPVAVELAPYNSHLYDNDEICIILNDISHEAGEMFMVGLPSRPPGPLPEAVLINGKGKYRNPATGMLTTTPYQTFYVTRGSTCRIRIISAISMPCPIQIQIENHRMKVIATDGSPVNPSTIDTLVMTSGERFDVVVNANQPNDMYWIHVRLGGICTFRNISQLAVLSYTPGSHLNDSRPSTPSGPYPRMIVLNDPALPCRTNALHWCISDLTNPLGVGLSQTRPTEKFYLTFSNRQLNTNTFFLNNKYTPFWNIRDRDIFLGTMNGISFEMPVSPVLGRPNLNGLNLCNSNNIPASCGNATVCTCTHMISVPFNSTVDFVLIDESEEIEPVVHPIHFHGLKFYVIHQGQILTNGSLTEGRVREVERQGGLRPNNRNPPLKDTVMVHSQGYVVIRFRADNPGFWLNHCHVDDHMLFGMMFLLNIQGPVGSPPAGFPQCGDFPPPMQSKTPHPRH